MNRLRRLPALAVVAIVIGLTACTPRTFDPESVVEVPSDPPAVEPAKEPELINACAALAGLDFDALMGEEMDDPIDGSSACTVKSTAVMSAATLHIQLNEDGTGTYANQKALLTVTEELEAPGDEAFLGDTALAKGLDVLVDGHHLAVRIHRQSSPISSDDLIAVADAVLTNLGW